MIIIRESNQNYLNQLGNNLKNNFPIRFMKYLLIVNIDNGKAIHNELTRAFIWISNEEWDNLLKNNANDCFNWLWNNYFLVNENYDEETMQEFLKKNQRLDCHDLNYLKQGKLETFTIFTTMACNARCFYCYEKGRPQVPMTSETARKVGDWIVKYAIKTGKSIELRWFGGEPLVNENAIDIICKIIQDSGYNYNSFITSNGFLFKEEKLQKYNELWHLTGCQITIDGTEEVYNKTKNYKNIKGISPYQVVCNNIKMLADHNINVSVRMNVDQYNFENIKLLIPELFGKFGRHPKIYLYNWPIYEDDDHPRTDEEIKQLYQIVKEADNILEKYGLYKPSERSFYVASNQCMIDSGHSVVIGTQGDIGLCEHFSEEKFWGHIDKPEMRDMKVIESFQEYEEYKELCKDCPIKPGCIKAKLCHDLRSCDEHQKHYLINKSLDSIRIMYQNWKINYQNKLENQQIQQKQEQFQSVKSKNNKNKKSKGSSKKHK